MSSVEELGLRITRDGVDEAVASLDRLSAASARAEKAAAAFGKSASDAMNVNVSPMQAMINATTGVSNAMGSARQSAQAFADAADSERARFESLRASVDPLFSSSKKYESVLQELSVAQKLGVASSAELSATQAAAEQKFLSLGAAEQTATQRMQEFRASIDPVFAASKQYESALTEIDAALQSNVISQQMASSLNDMAAQKYIALGDAQKTQKEQLDALRMSYNPLYAASKQYEAALTEINAAQKAGVVSEKEAVAMNEAAATGFIGVSKSVEQMNIEMVRANGGFALSRIQIMELMHVSREWGAMVAMGVNPLQATLMESGRIITFFQYGVNGLKTTFLSLGNMIASAVLSPVALTVAGLAAGATAVAYFAGAFDKGKPSLKEWDTISKELSSTTSGMDTAFKDALTPLQDLTKEYGENAKAIEKTMIAMAKYQEVLANDAVTTASEKLNQQFGGLQSMFAKFNELSMMGPGRMSGAQGAGFGDTGNLEALHNILQTIQHDYSMDAVQATKMVGAMKDFNTATTDNGKITAMNEMLAVLTTVRDTTGKVPKDVQDLVDVIHKAAIEEGKHGEKVKETLELERLLGGTDISSNIDKGTEAAVRLAAQLGISLSLAQKLGDMQLHTPVQNKIQAGIDAGMIPNVQSARVASGRETASDAFSKQDILGSHPNPTKHGGGGTKKLSDLQKEENTLLTQLDLGTKGYEMQLKALDDLLHKHLITLDQYNQKMADVKEKLLESTDAGKYFAQTTQSFETNISDLLGHITSLQDAFSKLLSILANLAGQLASGLFQDVLFGTGPFSGGGTIASPAAGSLFGGLISGLGKSLGIPGAAIGMDHARGGLTMVGENGPELVNLPKGAGVVPARPTRDLISSLSNQGGGAGDTHVHVKNINVLDPSIVGDYLSTAPGERAVMNIVRKNNGTS